MAPVTQPSESQRISAEPVGRLEVPDRLLFRVGRGTPLFLFPGGGGNLRELVPLATALKSSRPLVGVPYWEPDDNGLRPDSVGAMADRALSTILRWQPNGPYCVVGYSLGGLIAIEVARRLLQRGESVAPPILIDAVPHKSAWPLLFFLHVAVRYALYRARSAVSDSEGPDALDDDPGPEEAVRRCKIARQEYRPVRYDGPIVLLHALREPYVGGMAPKIWRTLALAVKEIPVAARHSALMRNDDIVAILARAIDEAVDDAGEAGKRRAVIATGVTWPATTRLARALADVGFSVEAVAPRGHPVRRTEHLAAFHALRPWAAQQSIESALMRSRPDLVIPSDDFVADLLHRLHADTQDGGVRALIERSLGNAKFYSHKFDRRWMIDIAATEGTSVPRTVSVEHEAELQEKIAKTGLPAFLKVDGSWGGLGVAKVHDLSGARRAWRRFSRRSRTLRAFKRAIFNGDVTGVDRLGRPQRMVFSLQEAKDGQLAIVSAVCHRGELLGMLSARVLSQQSAFGPATVIQMDDELPLRNAVAKIIRRLGLSGVCGFDFILSPSNGDPCFIELNPRATQTSDFIGQQDGDLLAKLLDRFGGRGQARTQRHANGDVVTIAKVPAEAEGASRDALRPPSGRLQGSALRD